MITNPMRKLQLADEEFAALCGLLFWNDSKQAANMRSMKSIFVVV